MYMKEVFALMNRFDTISEQLISDNMCTEKCPCLDYDFNDGFVKSNSKLQYDMVLEKHMSKYGRTNFDKDWATSKGMKPLVWTKDPNVGYKNFHECFKDPNKHFNLDRAQMNQLD